MTTKPLYGKVLVSREFPNKEQAEDFAKEMRAQYRETEMSLKYDVARTESGQWRSTVYVKL